MMPSILPTITAGFSAWATAVEKPTISETAKFAIKRARTAVRMGSDRGELAGDGLDLAPEAIDGGFVGGVLGDGADDLRYSLHVALGGPASGDRWRAKAHSTGDRRLARLPRDR